MSWGTHYGSSSKTNHTLFFLVLGLTLMGSVVGAQEVPKPYPLPIPHETVIVVAQDVPDDVRTTGRDVVVVRTADAQAAGFKTVADVLRFHGVLNIVTTGTLPGSTTSLFVRGGASSYTLVLVDNVPVNQIGGFYEFAYLPLDNVERIEILKGPGSTVYGSEAVTAVVRISTRKGVGRPKVRFSGLGGSFQTFGGTLASDGALGRGWNYSLSLGGLWSDRQLPVNDEYEGRSASVQIGAELPKGHAWALRYRFGDYEVHFPTTGAGDRFDIPDPSQFQRAKEHIVGFEWTAAWSARWTTRLDVGFFRQSGRYEDPDDGPPVDLFGPYWSEFLDRRLRLNAYTAYSAGGHRLMLGGTYTVETGGTRNIYQNDWDRHTRNTATLYIREDYESSDKRFGLTAGLRWEHHSDYANVLAPELSLAYWPIRTLKLRGSVGFGYKAPAFFQIHGLGQWATGNPNLKPERNVGWDVGFEYWGRFAWPLLRVTYFDNRFGDIITFVSRPDPTVPDYENLRAAVARGVEVDAEYRIGGLVARLSYAFTHTETTDVGPAPDLSFVEGQPLLRRPKHRATASLGYQTARLSGWVDVLYQGRRWDLDWSRSPAQRVEMDSYIRVDLRARWNFWRQVALIGRVENLLNTDYEEVYGYTGQKRAVYAGLDMTW
ncbi:MAG: TonB-dependent receptor [Acidobacteria bacterium]|nr:TonB-dependent receptor [Acidobacteriota bacterium]MDW7984039.1 TonB-dependent receptor [Acidobacteriota bacterium]